MSENEVYRMVAVQFAGKDRADQVKDLVKKYQKQGDYKVKAWAVVEIDQKGKAHVKQTGHGYKGAAAGAAVGGGSALLLTLLGGPVGILLWLVGGSLIGGVAGHYLGRSFDQTELEAMAASLEPNTSALVFIAEDKLAEEVADAAGAEGMKVASVTVGSQLSGEMATVDTIAVGESVDQSVD